MLGASVTPEEVPEVAKYDTVILDIKKNSDSEVISLSRSLQGGEFRLLRPGQDELSLRPKHDPKREDTLSHLLLEITGLLGKEVRKNQHGVTRQLSFRDLAHLSIVSEEEVIRSTSPVLTGQVVNATVEKSVFRLLLSGNDDSAVVASEEPKLSRARTEAKVEVVQELVEQTREQIEKLETVSDLSSLQNQLAQSEAAYDEALIELSSAQESVSDIEQRRRGIWEQLRADESRLDVLTGLAERFALLRQQYLSDLRRLEAIAETGKLLAEMTIERCPICGALAEHHDTEHQEEQTDPVVVAEATAAEANRIRSLIDDLDSTRNEVSREGSELEARRRDVRGELAAVGQEFQETLKPRMKEALSHFRRNQEEREGVRQAISLIERLVELEELVEEVEAKPKTVSSNLQSGEIRASEYEGFCAEVEVRLRAWNFPGLTRVTFSESDWDVVISGRRRTSHGKGVRAVTHAAFTFALLRYCVTRELPHPGFVVIDSPLVVYREPDADEGEFSHDVQASFFRDLAVAFGDEQLIVLENESPPQDLDDSPDVNVIRFTGTSSGRGGFIPSND